MKNNTLACSFLAASAFALAGLLLVTVYWRGGLESPANADLLVEQDGITLMTARTRADEEAVFIIDSDSETLLIYRLELLGSGGRLELAHRKNLRDRDLFGR